MAQPIEQLSINNSLKERERRVNFSQLSWLGLVAVACMVGALNGAPVMVAVLALLILLSLIHI